MPEHNGLFFNYQQTQTLCVLFAATQCCKQCTNAVTGAFQLGYNAAFYSAV
jgi:hypothetical protein